MQFISDAFLEHLIGEDIPWTDATTEALGISGVPGRITCFPKAAGAVSGIAFARRIFELAGLTVTEAARDGEHRLAGEVVLAAAGPAEAIHAVYKTAQNVMEYSSGITNRAAAMLMAAREANPRVQVAVTRKHFPGTKTLSLAAALAGGAIVHRAGLSESILVFDQHRVFCGDGADDEAGVIEALRRAKLREPEKKIAVEAGDPAEGMRYVQAGVDIVQCERFEPEELKKFVKEAKAVNPNLIVNAAGGINETNAASFAQAGADVLVTSSVYFGKPFDIKMRIERAE